MIETIEIVNQVNYAAVPVVPIIAWIVSIGSGVGWIWWESNQEPQINTELDQWGYKYLYLTQEERRKLPVNSNMKCGNWIGDLAIKKFG